MVRLVEVETIGPVYSERLKKAGVNSIEKLLLMGSTRKGRSGIAANTGLSEEQILNWVNRADLSRVKGIGTQYADLLEAVGVDTVPELAQRNPQNLYDTLAVANTENKRVRALPPLLAVEDWIKQAKMLPRAVHY